MSNDTGGEVVTVRASTGTVTVVLDCFPARLQMVSWSVMARSSRPALGRTFRGVQDVMRLAGGPPIPRQADAATAA